MKQESREKGMMNRIAVQVVAVPRALNQNM
jgi:hypothetical protein